MALISVTECTMLRGNAKADAQSPTVQRQFIVRFDSLPADFDAVTGATGLPAINAAYKTGDNRVCTSKSASSIGTTLDYLVTCDYTVPQRSLDPNPLNRPDVLTGGGTTRDRAYFKDFTSPTAKSIQNSAGEPFDKLPENTCGEWCITITGNRSTLDFSTYGLYLSPLITLRSQSARRSILPLGRMIRMPKAFTP